jgi:tetratricopeptide (TPR) repeat protein
MLKVQEQESRAAAAQSAQKSKLVETHAQATTRWRHKVSQKLGPDAQVIHLSHDTPDIERVDARVKTVRASEFSELPIHVRHLKVGTTHTGRVLRGKVLVQANLYTSVQTLIEDEAGDCVRVVVYTVPERRNSLQERLGIGIRVAIVSPFFKLMADGDHGVRVDDAPGTFFIISGPDADVDRWRDEARLHFQQKQFFEAELAYSHALRLISFNLCNTLVRLAHAHLLLGDDQSGLRSALLFAVAGFALDSGSAPAVGAVALALHGLGFPIQANGFANFIAKQTAAIQDGGLSTSCAALLSNPARGDRTNVSDLIVVTSLLIEGGGRQTVPPLSVDSDVDCVRLGDESLKAGLISDAVAYFTGALCLHSDVAAVLLSNRAQCRLMLSQPAKALLDAHASLALQPDNIKSHYRRASALIKLGEPWLAVKAATVDLVATNADFIQLREKISVTTAPNLSADFSSKITLQLHSDWFYPVSSQNAINYAELMERFRSAAEVSPSVVTRDEAYTRLSAAIKHAVAALPSGSVVLAYLRTDLIIHLLDLTFKSSDRLSRYGDATYDPVAWEKRRTRVLNEIYLALSKRYEAGTLALLDPAENEFWRHYSDKHYWQGLRIGHSSVDTNADLMGITAVVRLAFGSLISWRNSCHLENSLTTTALSVSVNGLDSEKTQLWKTVSRQMLSHRIPPEMVVGAVALVLKIFSTESFEKSEKELFMLSHSVDAFISGMNLLLEDEFFRGLMAFGTGALIRSEWERNQAARATLLRIQSIWTSKKKDMVHHPIPEVTCDVCGGVSTDYKQFRRCEKCKVHLCTQACFTEHLAKKHNA